MLLYMENERIFFTKVIMSSFLIVCTLFITACGPFKPRNVDIDVELVPVFSLFVQEARLRHIKLNSEREYRIELVDTIEGIENRVIGRCVADTTRSIPRYTIKFLRGYWMNASNDQKEILAFHEFGHCMLDRDHKTGQVTIDNVNINISLMNPETIPEYSYRTFRNYYLDELFYRN